MVDEDDERVEMLRNPVDDAASVLGLLVGKPGRRLVEQDDPRLADDGPRELDEASIGCS